MPPKTQGKVGERIAQEQVNAAKDVEDIYAEEPPETPAEPPVVAVTEPPVVPATPEAVVPAVEPAVVTPTDPPAPPTPPPDPNAANKDQALKLEREHWRKKQAEWETEKKAILDAQAAQAAELAKIRERDAQFEDLFKPEETEEEKQTKQFWAEVERRAEDKARAANQSTEQRAANLELQFGALQSQQAHPDFAKVTGWTGNSNQLLDPEHPFTQYLKSSPVVLDQIYGAPNKGEALYLAARNFALSQPGAMDQELESRIQSRLDAERARIVAEEEAKYKAALAKFTANPNGAPPGLGSIAAIPAGGSTPQKPFDPDEYNPYNMTPEKRALFGQGFADIYAD